MNAKIQNFNPLTVKSIKTFKEEKIMERDIAVLTQKRIGGVI